MNTTVITKRTLIGFLILLMSSPPWVLAQRSGSTGPTFSQQELDQLLAPIALYPDAMLAQVLVAATYPDEVTEAARWVQENSNLTGEALNDAVDQQDWDLSVKALVPFPKVLAMMSDQIDWTQKLGNAFLAQQDDVMNTVQKLREKARAQGNLRDTSEQRVVVEQEVIQIEPTDPQVVYIPTYNPTVVYGPWWWPGYPPYYYNPFGLYVATGLAFAAGIWVGSGWYHGWGHWDWQHHHLYTNVNRNVNINRNISTRNIPTSKWQHDVNRGKVAYRGDATGQRVGQGRVGSPESRKDFRGHDQQGKGQAISDAGRQGQRQAGAATGTRPTTDSTLKGLQQREGRSAGGYDRAGKTAFEGSGRGDQAQMHSERGTTSRSAPVGGAYRGGGSGYGGGHGGGFRR